MAESAIGIGGSIGVGAKRSESDGRAAIGVSAPCLAADLAASVTVAVVSFIKSTIFSAIEIFHRPANSRGRQLFSLHEGIALLLPILKIHDYGDHVGETDVLKLLSRQRRSATGLALHVDLSTCVNLRRVPQLLPDAEF